MVFTCCTGFSALSDSIIINIPIQNAPAWVYAQPEPEAHFSLISEIQFQKFKRRRLVSRQTAQNNSDITLLLYQN